MDYFEPKTILIALTLVVFLAIVTDLMRRKKRNRYENLQMSSRELERSSRGDIEDDPFAQSQFPSGPSRVVKVRDDESRHPSPHNSTPNSALNSTVVKELKTASSRQPEQGALFSDSELSGRADIASEQSDGVDQSVQSVPKAKPQTTDDATQEVLVIHLMANKNQPCSGRLLLDSAVSLGLRYGAMKIFHRHTDKEGFGPILFSMANLMNPGIFDLNTMGDLNSNGVTLFMTPEELDEPVDAFDLMLETAEKLALQLQLNIMDESRSSMTKQTIDHYRQRAQKIAFHRGRSD